MKYLCESDVQHCGKCPACARNAKASNSAVMPGYNWTPELPTEAGIYWFYGYRYGKVSFGRKQEKELLLVRASPKNSNGACMLVSEGTIMFKSELEEPMFTPVKLPPLPEL
jgi:hypothetical protein